MAFGSPQVFEFGQIETDDANPRKKRVKIAQRRIRRRVINQDGSADVVAFRTSEVGADLDLRVACAALNFQASKANSNFRIFNDDFSTALLTKRVRMQQRIAGNWENLDLPFTAYRTITRNGRGQDFAAWGWRYRTSNVGVMNVVYEQELGASKWSYDFRNLGAASGEFRIVQRLVLLVDAQEIRPIYRQDGLSGPLVIAGYSYRFASGERIAVDWSDQAATGDFASARADETLTAGSGIDIISSPFTLAANESKTIDPTYTSDAGWSGHAVGSGAGAWGIDSGSGNSNGMGLIGGVEIRTVMRFPTTTVPTTATVDSVTLEFQTVNVNAMAYATILFRIGPHAGDGRTDPEPETFSTSWTNADNSGDYYVNGITALRSTGPFSQLLGSTANSDLQSARGASVAFFSLSLNGYGGGGNTFSQPAAYNNSTGSYQPNLIIEYTESGGGGSAIAAIMNSYRRRREQP